VLINCILMTCARRYFEARHRPEAPECWCHLKQAIWPEVYTTDLTACKQVLAKNNSRTKRSNLAKFPEFQKNHYKMKMISTVSNKAGWSKKVRGEPEALTGVYVNSVYQITPGWDDIRVFDFFPSRLRIWDPMP